MSFLKNKKVKRNMTVILAVLSSFVLFIGRGDNENASVEVRAEKSKNDSVQMYAVPSAEKVFVNGVVTPQKTETFTSNTEFGVMENVKVQSGEYVDKGYHMFSYRDASKEEQIKQKEKEMAEVENEIKELQQNSAENRQQIIYLNNKVKSLKESIDELKSKIITNVYAPFAGEVHIETLDEESKEMLIMLDTKEYYLDGKISEQDYAKIKIGMPTDVYLFSTKEARAGAITYLSKRPESAVDEETKNANLSKYRVKIGFSDQAGLVNGYHAQAKIEMASKEIKVPVTAIEKEEDKYYVLVDEMGIAKRREIKTSYSDTDAMAVVKEGLSENEMIVENIKESKVKEGDSLYELDSSNLSFSK